jgi:hypothetical protein
MRVGASLPWVITIFVVLTVGVFAVTWLSGSPLWVVVFSTLVVAFLTAVGLTTTGPVLRTRVFRTVAHLVLGLFVSVVALFVTLFSAAAGVLTLSPTNVVVFGSLWGLGIALLVSGVSIPLGARRLLRGVATVGLGLAVFWGAVVAVMLGDLVVHGLLEGFDPAIGQDLRDDLIPLLVVSIAFVALPAMVFRQDLRELRTEKGV